MNTFWKKNYQSIEKNRNEPILKNIPFYKQPVTKQYFAALTASLMSMGTGCVGGWSSSAIPLLMEGLATDLGGIELVTEQEASWITSLINLGSLIGSLPAGQMSFYYGRRKFLLILAVLLIIGWIFIIWNGNDVGYIYVGRFLCGFAAGSVCVALSMYSNEICSDVIRGRAGVFYDTMQVFGILFVYCTNAVTTLFWSSVICLMIPIVFLCLFYWMPESPLHLIKNGEKEKAINSIRWLHGNDCDVEHELTKIYIALLEGKKCEMNDDESNLSFLHLRKFFNTLSKTTVKAVAIILFLFIVQRSSGAPLVVYYTVDIFKAMHSKVSPETATVYAGLSQCLFSITSILLVDRIGRKILLIFSLFTMILSMATCIIYLILIFEDYNIAEQYGWIPVLAICIFVGIFRLGLGPIPWFLCAELISTDAQRWALPIIFFVTWSAAFFWTKSYLAAVAAFGYIPVFSFFMIICCLGLLHTLVIPETKNKSRIEIQKALGAEVLSYSEVKSSTGTISIIKN